MVLDVLDAMVFLFYFLPTHFDSTKFSSPKPFYPLILVKPRGPRLILHSGDRVGFEPGSLRIRSRVLCPQASLLFSTMKLELALIRFNLNKKDLK